MMMMMILLPISPSPFPNVVKFFQKTNNYKLDRVDEIDTKLLF